MCKSSKMRVSKRAEADTSIIYGGAEVRLRGVLEPPEPPPVHVPACIVTDLQYSITTVSYLCCSTLVT